MTVADVLLAKPGDACTGNDCSCNGKGILKAFKGIEVGQVFHLGKKYSEAFNATCLGGGGSQSKKFLNMGCYGIGISRVLAAAVEQKGGHDEKGICWPLSIAPFRALVLTAPAKTAQLRSEFKAASFDVYDLLDSNEKIKGEVLLDDRWNSTYGVKMKDAELTGIPFIVLIGKHFAEHSKVEVFSRNSGKVELVSPQRAVEIVVSS